MKLRFLLPFFLLGLLTASTPAQSIPPVNAKALDDSQVILPPPTGHQLLILLIGFSHKSGDACGSWAMRLVADYTSDPHTAYYQLAELQSAPSFVRGMILHGMRKDVPAAQHSRFVPLYDHEPEWKKAVNFTTSAPDDPYIVVTAPGGDILWQTHGSFTDSSYSDLKSAVAKLTVNPTKSQF